MAYIGNTVNNQGFTPAIDYFSGNGSTVTFTLSRPVASVAQVIVAIDNVIQNSSTAYSVTGNAITFTSAPLSGSNNIWVQYTSLITTYNAISQDPSVIGDLTASGGFLSTGDFGNTYTDGTIVDYVTGNARITTGPADGITLYNGGTSSRTALMTLDASGNMGVGTTTPALTLNVKGPSSDYRTALFETASTNGPSVQIKGSKTYELRSTDSGASEGAGLFFIYDKNNELSRLAVTSTGNVGVGTTTPAAKLSVEGARSNVDAASGGHILIKDTAAYNASPAASLQFGIKWKADGTYAYGSSIQGIKENATVDNFAQALVFTTQANGDSPRERARIAANGDFLVGTTSFSTTTDGAVVSSAGIGQTSNSGFNLTCYKAAGAPQGAYLVFFWNNGLAGYVNYNGSGVTYNTTSDVRLKENIVDAPSAISTLQSLQVRSFDWKESNKHDDFGFVAQELYEVYPDAVTEQKDKEDGSMDMPWGVDYAKLVPVLVKAVQEQQTIIEDLKARIETLEAK